MRKTKIEWTGYSWNPLTGCLHNCPYCYARSIARRFAWKKGIPFKEEVLTELVIPKPIRDDEGKVQPYPAGFNPTFHKYRLDEPKKLRGSQTIFVCSMADLFGDWVPDSIIDEVFEACRQAPQHRYLFLTKNPHRYEELSQKGILRWNDIFWCGTTYPGNISRLWIPAKNPVFWSCEPLLRPWTPEDDKALYDAWPEWVILGAETGNRKGRVVPKKEWVDHIVRLCGDMGISVFMKDSLIPIVGEENMRREFPFT